MINNLLSLALSGLIDHLLKHSTKRRLAFLLLCLYNVIVFLTFLQEYGMVLELVIIYVRYAFVLFDVDR